MKESLFLKPCCFCEQWAGTVSVLLCESEGFPEEERPTQACVPSVLLKLTAIAILSPLPLPNLM